MKRHRTVSPCVVALLLLASPELLPADSPQASPAVITAAIQRALPLLERAAAGSTQHRQCFTCHGHALPVLALVAAQKRGLAIDEQNLQAQLEHTAADLSRGQAGYLQGRGQGGRHIRAGYALWTLQAGGWRADDATAAATGYLVWDEDDEHWRSPSNRPPSEVSHFTATYVALRGLAAYGTKRQADRIANRKEKALAWLVRTPPQETEDRVFRLLALHHLEAADDVVRAAAEELLTTQREDGGWAQTAARTSDAYATGSALYALYLTAVISPDDPVYQRGINYLLSQQREDGSWHVRSRSKPFQTYYESGFPHDADQFISMAASSWATLALLFTRPTSPQQDSAASFPAPRFLTSTAGAEDLWPCFSADSTTLLFSRKDRGESSWYLYAVGLAELPARPFPHHPPRIAGTRANWSRTRDLIAFNGASDRGQFSLCLIDGNGGSLRQLDFNGITDRMSYPSWYPDGNSFAVVDFAFQQGSAVQKIDLEQKTVVRLTDPGTHWAGVPRVSPDGKRIVMGGQQQRGQRYTQYENRLWLLDREGMKPFDSQRGWAPCWSPDGKWFVFASDRNSEHGLWSIFLASPDGSTIKQLTPPEEHASHPTWSPDGKLIAYSARPSPGAKTRAIAVLEVPSR